MEINDDDIFKINGPLDLTFLSKLAGIEGYDDLKGKGYTPQPAKWIDANKNIFEQIKEHDALLNHPYETFEPVIELVAATLLLSHRLQRQQKTVNRLLYLSN